MREAASDDREQGSHAPPLRRLWLKAVLLAVVLCVLVPLAVNLASVMWNPALTEMAPVVLVIAVVLAWRSVRRERDNGMAAMLEIASEKLIVALRAVVLASFIAVFLGVFARDAGLVQRGWTVWAMDYRWLAGLFLALAVDGMLAFAMRVRGRRLGIGMAQTAFVWLWAMGMFTVLARAVPAPEVWEMGLLIVGMVAAGLLQDAQGLLLWLGCLLVLTGQLYYGAAALSGLSSKEMAAARAGQFVVGSLAGPLALATVGLFVLYVHRVAGAARAARHTAVRVGMAIGVVLWALVLAETIVVATYQADMLSQRIDFLSRGRTSVGVERLNAAKALAGDLSGRFTPAQLASATPEVVRALGEMARGDALRLVIADASSGRVYAVSASTGASISAGDLAARVQRVLADPTGGADGGLGGTGDFAVATRISDGTGGSGMVLVLLPGTAGSTAEPADAYTLSSAVRFAVMPWVFALLLLPMSLALLAYERADRSRAELMYAQERARLSRDAHDRIYNRMTALAGRLETEAAQTGGDLAPSQEIRGAVSDLQRILGDAEGRAVSTRDVGASIFDDVVIDQARRYGMTVTLSGQEYLSGLDPRLAWDLQCAVEEALTNAGRHGNARTVQVAASRAGSMLRIVVTDDGTGLTEPLGDDGLPVSARGLRGMRERIAGLGGTLAVAGAPGATTVTMEVPAPVADRADRTDGDIRDGE